MRSVLFKTRFSKHTHRNSDEIRPSKDSSCIIQNICLKRKLNAVCPLFILVFSLLAVVSCRKDSRSVRVERTGFLMDTIVRISVYGGTASKSKVERAIEQTFKGMRELEGLTSAHIDSSEVGGIVRNAGKHSVSVSPAVYSILKQSIGVSENSRGAFDVTIGAVKSLWDFESDSPQIPGQDSIRLLLRRVDYRKLELKEGSGLLRDAGMEIDLGGIAKGYIIDRSVEILKEEGIGSGIVEAGGDLRIFGRHPQRESWTIGIRHPRSEKGELIGILKTGECAIATSGDYERCFFRDGRRYHHILDPKTGFPAMGCVSVTIVAQEAVLSDAYATAVFVLGPEKGMELIESEPSLEGLILYEENGKLCHMISKGLIGSVQLN